MVPLLMLIVSITLRKYTISSDVPCAVYAGASGVCVCNASYCDSVDRPPRLARGYFHHYSTSNSHPGFSSTTGIFTQDTFPGVVSDVTFTINSTTSFQNILGFGGSFTDSVGILLSGLPEGAQERFIESYFGPTGIEYTLCRMPIGGSDFSPRQYTLADAPCSTDLRYFGLAEEDYRFKIPYIKKAIAVSLRGISLIACPWNSPQWMKTKYRQPQSISGYLKRQYYQIWAEYYVKFIKAYKENGINIWAISGGNEPLVPFLGLSLNNTLGLAHQHRIWVKEHLIPQLKSANLTDVKYFTFEDIRPFVLYWMNRFAADPEALQLVDGIALHWYADYWFRKPHILDILHRKYPSKTILSTEISINIGFARRSEAVNLGSWNRAALYIYSIIEYLSHWTSGVTDWNLALNTEGGPHISLPIDAPVIINTTSGEFYKQPMFYAMGHFSKFIPPGSKRIHVESSLGNPFEPKPLKKQTFTYPVQAPDVVLSIATANSDGSYTAVVFNNNNVSVRVRLDVPQLGSASLDIEQHSINTLVYWID